MDGPLERLTYFSRNLLHGPHWRVAEEMDALLRVARIRNAYLRITGALLCHDDCFAQILEGESEDLTWVFAAITADPRHCEVTLLQRTPIAERAFPDWTMHYVEPECLMPPPGAARGESLFQRLATLAHGGV
ncbi:MAG: BLUF domain-containing protein [Roseococcus sp.]|nr:BLUF domain-containing protein [Roseococcus sp.]